LVLRHPQFFHRALLESASPGLQSQEERNRRRHRDERLAQEIINMDLAEFLNRWYDQPLFTSLRQHSAFEKMVRQRLQNNPQGLAKSLRSMGTSVQPSLWPELRDAKIPLFLLSGGLDVKFCRIAAEMERQSPQIQNKVIPGCGHNIHLENPQLFAAEIIQFFNRLEEDGV
ncbi:MAG: 2-succinyl-6-hydroxy-2,4-cyclohexadiene-1-carboxylate synthase, partial [Calditrichia bacterium]